MTERKSLRSSDASTRISEEVPLTRWLDRSLGAMCAIILAAMAGVLSLQVFMRFVVESPLIWVDEVARLTLIWLTFIGAALAYRTKSHIAITLLLDTALTKRQDGLVARALRVFVEVAVFVAAVALTIGGVVILAQTSDHATPALEMPISVLYLPAPLAGAIMLGTAIRHGVSHLTARGDGSQS